MTLTDPLAGSMGAARPRRADACAAMSAAVGEPMVGRGGGSPAWILLEHPGPWPADAVDEILGPALTTELDRRAPRARVLLVRRPDRPRVGRPRCFLAWSRGKRPWVRALRLDDYEQVLDLDLDGLCAGGPVEDGTPWRQALFAVCTHGRKDACCAEFGRPVVLALDVALGGRVWEATHVGGDRFAANLVAFPHGLYFGHLTPSTALTAAGAYLDGRVHLPNLRGRSGVPAPAQAAEHFVRAATGLDAVDAVVPGAPHERGGRVFGVEVLAGDRRVHAEVALRAHGQPRAVGCGHDEVVQRDAWTLVAIDGAHPDGLGGAL